MWLLLHEFFRFFLLVRFTLRINHNRSFAMHKLVEVRQYQRFRFGRFETVCKHRRSHPKR